jgi:ABC-type Fe3+-hydroxamate transport system substrate-binding protein
MGILTLVAACASSAESVPPTSSTTEAGATTEPAPTPAAGAGRAAVPTQTERFVVVGDRSVTLLPYVWRNLQPGGPSRGVFFSGTISSPEGSLPAGLAVLRFWLVMDTEVWTDSPVEVRRWSSPQTGIVTF